MTKQWHVLDSGRVSDILRSKERFKQLEELQWDYYSELEFQRNQVRDELKASLREKTKPFEFQQWQRSVKYRYSLSPLSTAGSLASPGGRFNVGEIDPTRYPVFPALYIAGDKGTSLAEVLGREDGIGALTPEQLALTKPNSITTVSISGKLESVLDIRERNNLAGFVDLIKNFRLSGSLIVRAKKLEFPLQLARTAKELGDNLEKPDWRNWPTAFDVPHTCQVFGRLVLGAGIEGILYNSSLTKRTCLAIFPQNFLNSSAFVELDDAAPTTAVQRRIDMNNFRNFV